MIRNLFKPLTSKNKPAETITSGLYENNTTKQFADAMTSNADEFIYKLSDSSIHTNSVLCFRCGHSLNDVHNVLSCEFVHTFII